MAAMSFILQEGAQQFSSVPVWTEPSQLLAGGQPAIGELLLRRFQAILFITNHALRFLLAAILPASRLAGSPHESVLSKQSSNSDWNSIQ
jgi:hypothetical protein